METKKECDRSVEEYVSRIVTPVFERVLQETPKNQMLVGEPGFSPDFPPERCHYQPHNYRLFFDYCKDNFDPSKPTNFLGCLNYKIINSSEHFFNFNNFSVRVKKTQIQITNKSDHKRCYPIDMSLNSEEQFIKIINHKDNECVEFFKKFINFYGGSSQFKILKRESENKIMQEDIIDLIPIKMKFDNKVCKKVYNEHNVEFKDPAFASNYILNRSLESVAPHLVERLDIMNAFKILKAKVKSVSDVLNYPHLIQALNNRQKRQFERWLFCLN